MEKFFTPVSASSNHHPSDQLFKDLLSCSAPIAPPNAAKEKYKLLVAEASALGEEAKFVEAERMAQAAAALDVEIQVQAKN